MKILTKIWEWLSIFFLGIIAGIIVFIKFLDTPETVNEIIIKKIKNKDADNNVIDLEVEIQDNDTNNNIKKKKKIRNIFKRNKK